MSKSTIVAIILILGAVFIAITSMLYDSITVDEIAHIPAGYTALTKLDLRFNPEHPPLAKIVSAAPLLLLNLNDTIAFQTKEGWLNNDVQYGVLEFGRYLLFRSNNNPNFTLFIARLPMLIFMIGSALIIFFWGRKLFDNKSALLALVLFLFSPTVLAHSRLVTTDMPATFGTLLAIFTFVSHLKKQTRRSFLFLFFASGIAFLLKFSTLLLIPFFVIISLIFEYFIKEKNSIGAILLPFIKNLVPVALSFLFIIWPVYIILTINYPITLQKQQATQSIGGSRNILKPLALYLSDKPILRGAGHYLSGIIMVADHNKSGHPIYFLGKNVLRGGPLYFPFVYFVKEPLTWWLLAFVAAGYLIYRFTAMKQKIYINEILRDHFEIITMILWLTMYWLASITSHINIGIRHLLPAYPFMIMLVSATLVSIRKEMANRYHQKIFTKSILIISALYIAESVFNFPNYIPYFNQIAGGSYGGSRYVLDSNVDWGQDLYRFRDWLNSTDIKKISFDYFSGWADPAYYIGSRYVQSYTKQYKNAADFIVRNPSNGWLAVSLEYAKGSADYAWLKNYTPVTIVGHSIVVYHITR